MAEEFRDIIAVLWKALGLPRPRFRQEDGAVTLTVDGVAIMLAVTRGHRHIAVSAKAGELSANPVAMNAQVAYLLRASLPALPSSRACTCLDEQDSVTPAVMVKAIIPCSATGASAFHSAGNSALKSVGNSVVNSVVMDRLVKAISDVACLAREHARVLAQIAGNEQASASHRLPEENASDMVVFRL
jgi:hypothetical protein